MPREPGPAGWRELAQCGAQCLDARDGRGRRWARQRAVQALVARGDDAALAHAAAHAMERIAQCIADAARR